MSNVIYNELWHEVQKKLDEAASADVVLQAEDPETDNEKARKAVGEIYLQYILTTNKLEECYDQIVQPQKRILIRKLLDASLGRIVELKHDLVNIELEEFTFVDDMLVKLGMSPLEAEVNIPRYFLKERADLIRERRQTIDDILRKLGYYDEELVEEKMTELEAIRIIQIHERARQGRLRAQFMKEIRMLKEKGKQESATGKADSAFMAAMKIQTMWRGFAARRKIRKRKIEEMILIGMIPPPKLDTSASKQAEKIRQARYKTQEKHQKEYEKALLKTKQDIYKMQGDVIKEDIGDEVRNWFQEYEKTSGKLPEFPSEESGGSRLIFSRQGTESSISKSTAISSRESKKSKAVSKSAKAKTINGEGEEEPDMEGFKAAPSMLLPDIKGGIEVYEEVWMNKDESNNPQQAHYDDMIYADKHSEVETELRKIVDEMMRNELEILQAAVDRDRAQKGKKAKKPQKKKTRRSGKKGKKKKEKDLTPDRTLESLYEELVTNGIIRKYNKVSMSSYLGERSYVPPKPNKQGLGDVRQILKEYCILPLGSEIIHQNVPLVKSLMIAGPHGSGKHMLVDAICTEVGAALFDLSPANIVGKYPGKSGLIMLMHLVSKMSRLLQPSIIYMEDAEKPFMKKVPKTDKTDPKRLKKDLPKLIKGISAEDQVMLIGISNCPWESDQKLLQQVYQRYIMIPRPGYGCLSHAWKELLRPYSGVSRQFDMSAMARISDGYTIGCLSDVVKEVITCKRMLQLRIHPLTHAELIGSLCKRDPVYKEEDEAFDQWWQKTPLGRKKQRIMDLAEQQDKVEKEGNVKKKK